ncbi:hypothetical protein [Kitasatospora purpeofusca]|uniref:hypothetical protein n=1 Tax=Kitasatospora purpeofusca TaxID=67352 RepID=UPI00386A7A8E
MRLVAPPCALATGRAPRQARPRLEPVRPRGWGLLLLYADLPAHVVPRALGADDHVVLAGAAVGGLLATAGLLLLVVPSRRRTHRPATTADVPRR